LSKESKVYEQDEEQTVFKEEIEKGCAIILNALDKVS